MAPTFLFYGLKWEIQWKIQIFITKLQEKTTINGTKLIFLIYINMNNKYKLIKLLLVLPLFLSLNSFTNSDSIEVGQVWKLNVRSSASMNGSGEYYIKLLQTRITLTGLEYWWLGCFSVVDSRDLVRLRKGYEIEVTEKLYSNEVLKVKLLDGRYKGRFYYAIADDLTKKYLLEEKEEENEDYLKVLT